MYLLILVAGLINPLPITASFENINDNNIDDISSFLLRHQSAREFRLISRRCDEIHKDKVRKFEDQLWKIWNAEESAFEGQLAIISILYRELRMSGYFVPKRSGILKRWMLNCVNITIGDFLDFNGSLKIERILFTLMEESQEMMEYPIELGPEELGTQVAEVKEILIVNSKDIAFHFDVFFEHTPQRMVAGMLQQFFWSKLLELMDDKLIDLNEGNFARFECDKRSQRLLMNVMVNRGLEPIAQRRSGFPQQLMLIPPYSLWRKLHDAKGNMFMRNFNTTNAIMYFDDVQEYVSKEIFTMIIAMMRSNHTEYSNVYPIVVEEWLKESTSCCLHQMIWFGIREASIGGSATYPTHLLLTAIKDWNISLFSKTLRGVIEYNEMCVDKQYQPALWNVIGQAISVFFEESHHEHSFNIILARAAWHWQTEREWIPETKMVIRSSQNKDRWFHDGKKLQEIHTALPWLFTEKFIEVWKKK